MPDLAKGIRMYLADETGPDMPTFNFFWTFPPPCDFRMNSIADGCKAIERLHDHG